MNLDRAEKKLREIEGNLTVQNFIAQANSRYILFCVEESSKYFPKYTDGLDERCISIAFSYLEIGISLYYNDHKYESVFPLEKAATILEYIYTYEGCNLLNIEYGKIACSLAYYAASQYSKSFIILSKIDAGTEIAKLIKLFLSKDLSELQVFIDSLIIKKEFDVDGNQTEIITLIFTKCIFFMTKFIFEGAQEYVINAEDIINDLIELSVIEDDPSLWWVFRLFKLIIHGVKSNSLWECLEPLSRGIGSELTKGYILTNAYSARPITELFLPQIESLRLIYNEIGGVISIPTSAGKTKIAEIAVLNSLTKYPNGICLYIAPFRSLAYEVEEAFTKNFVPIGFKVSHLYGNAQYNYTDKLQIEKANIIIATQEKAKAILRASDHVKENIQLVIVDEGHLIGAEERHITSELLIEELKAYLANNLGSIYLLSAVLPNLSEFSEWISGDEFSFIESKWRPSSQRFGVLKLIKNNVDIEWVGDLKSYNKAFIEPRLIKKEGIVKKSKRVIPAKYYPEDKKQAVSVAAVKLSNFGSVLIYVGRANMVESYAKEVASNIEDGNHTWKNENDYILFSLACKEAYGEDSNLLMYANKGIICHSGKLPLDVRLMMERLMRNGNAKIIIATSTLAQGVNIGVSTVIIANVWIGFNNILKHKDFWNISGRAGRAFTDTEGKILYAIDKNQDNWRVKRDISLLNSYFDDSNIEPARSGLYTLLRAIYNISEKCNIEFEYLVQLIAENNFNQFNYTMKDENGNEIQQNYEESVLNLFDLIDDTLLSLNEKYQSHQFSNGSYWVDDVFRQSLAFIEASKDNVFDEDKTLKLLQARNEGVLKIVGSPEKWKLHTNNSVSLRVSIEIDRYINEILNYLKQYKKSDIKLDDLLTVIARIDDLVRKLPTKSLNDFIKQDMDEKTLRSLWFSGAPFSNITDYHKDAIKVCNEYYGFQFTWIVSAISKKLSNQGFEEESDLLDYISTIAEIGLPNILSAEIYMIGIKSRVASVEISKVIKDEYDQESANVEKYINENVNVIKEKVSSITGEWLNEIIIKKRELIIKSIEKYRIRYSNPEFNKIDEFLVKEKDGVFYIISSNYDIKKKIKIKDESRIKEIVTMNGLYFEREGNTDSWLLKSRNPLIDIR